MKRIFILCCLVIVAFSSCRWSGYKRVKGSGNIITEDRHISAATKIKLSGSYDVEITQGGSTSVKVEADDNFMPYIITDEEDGVLVIKSRDNINFFSDHNIKIYIVTDRLEGVQLAGSGNITGKNKFTGGNKMMLKIAGSGDMKLELNTPSVDAEIAGSGTMTLSGETRDQLIRISGVGDYNAEGLKTENTTVRVAGSGDVKVFADGNLDINITGVGSVYYKGAATVRQHVAGSGEVKRID